MRPSTCSRSIGNTCDEPNKPLRFRRWNPLTHNQQRPLETPHSVDTALYDELQQVEHTHWWFRARRQIVWRLVERFIGPPNGRRLQICELGCGTGGNLAAVAKEHDVIGV